VAVRGARKAGKAAADNPGGVLVVALVALAALSQVSQRVRDLPADLGGAALDTLRDVGRGTFDKAKAIGEAGIDRVIPDSPEYWNPFQEFWEEDIGGIWRDRGEHVERFRDRLFNVPGIDYDVRNVPRDIWGRFR
jgi:hypothetical protein